MLTDDLYITSLYLSLNILLFRLTLTIDVFLFNIQFSSIFLMLTLNYTHHLVQQSKQDIGNQR